MGEVAFRCTCKCNVLDLYIGSLTKHCDCAFLRASFTCSSARSSGLSNEKHNTITVIITLHVYVFISVYRLH